MPETGIIVGKFLPPHRGHHHLIEVAQAQVADLVVFVCSRPTDDVPADVRAGWLREVHPTTDVRVVDDPYPAGEGDSALWAAAAIGWLGHSPDVAFTSEDYGPLWAAAMGCRHVMVDRDRRTVPCSATMVRRDPRAAWAFLTPCVRAHYAVRICVVGAESTGTTTLAMDLARRDSTICVPEYGRDYWVAKHGRGESDWTTDEFVHIAEEQARREDAAARECNGLLICDTDAWATATWHERYVGHRSPEVESIAAARRPPHLYLLTDIDIPFVQDGTRDGAHMRDWMHQRFRERLAAGTAPWIEVRGSADARLQRASAAIDEILHAQQRTEATAEPPRGPGTPLPN